MHQTHPSTACGTAPPGNTTRGQGSKSKTPQSKRTTKKAAAAPAPAQELVKASRQASNNRGKRQGALKQAGGERGYGRPEERGRGVGRPEEWNRRVGKPGAQGTGEAGDWGQEGADAQGKRRLARQTAAAQAMHAHAPSRALPSPQGLTAWGPRGRQRGGRAGRRRWHTS